MRYKCQKVLPTIYNESLSYYEVLCKLYKIIDDLDERLEKVESSIASLDERVTALEQKGE